MTPRVKKLIAQNEVLRHYHPMVLPEEDGRRRFLDLSCGTRTDIREIVESLGHEWTGVDQFDWPGVTKADVHHLPFGDATFDVVFSAATFEHYYNPWQVAKEVSRVLKRGGIFCGLIAFIQPWHGDSYYHFSHLGTRKTLEEIGLQVFDIRAGDMHGVTYLIQTMFPEPFAFIGKVLSAYGRLLAFIRKGTFPFVIHVLYANRPNEKQHKLDFLKDDDLRYAASIVFLAKKSDS